MDLREKVCLGAPLDFDPAAPEKDRLVEAAWIEEGVSHHVRVNLEHAVVRGQLNLRYGCIEKELRLAFCTILGRGDFSYATFKGVVDLSGSTFHLAPDFQSSLFQFDVLLEGTSFLAGEVRWSRATVQQRLLAERVAFKDGANANFDTWTCGDSAVFTNAAFGGTADFSGAKIRGSGRFSGACFRRPVTFENSTIETDLVFGVGPDGNPSAAVFEDMANFRGVHVGRRANFGGAEFHSEALFTWAQIKGATFFGTDAQGLHAARFADKADFQDAALTGDADFEGVVFRNEAKFTSVNFEGTATFKGAEFQDAAKFDGIHVGEELNFENAQFRSTDKQASFEKAVVKSSLFFSNANFDGEASFEGIKIEGTVGRFCDARFSKPVSFAVADFKGSSEFHRAQFRPDSKPVFDGVHFACSCSFDRAVFEGDLCFRAAGFDGEASFQGVRFRKTADFSASHFAGIARFEGKQVEPGGAGQIPPAAFDGAVSFEHARFDRDARFADTLFKATANFRETSFRVLYFADNGKVGDQKQLQGAVDLTGCTYERIQADWRSLLSALHAYEKREGAFYNRQPYAQLEKVYRAVGQDRAADDIYLQRRHFERKLLEFRREPIGWILDRLYMGLANYGVRPRQLILCAIICIVLGTLAFHRPGSVQAKKEAISTSSNAAASPGCPVSNQNSLSVWDSARLTVRYFLPVDVSLLSHCEASENYCLRLRFQDWAALLRVFGWILVPVGIASLAGILRRVAP
jgi:uncharacterized protein YjbI with pentapeptide repeats